LFWLSFYLFTSEINESLFVQQEMHKNFPKTINPNEFARFDLKTHTRNVLLLSR